MTDYSRQSSLFRSVSRNGVEHPVVLVSDGPEVMPALAGATVVNSVDSSGPVALDPPTAGAQVCWIRVWHAAQDSTKRLFYRRDATPPQANGSNAEGYLLHGEGRMVRLATLSDFQMISETGAAHTVYAEYTNTK